MHTVSYWSMHTVSYWSMHTVSYWSMHTVSELLVYAYSELLVYAYSELLVYAYSELLVYAYSGLWSYVLASNQLLRVLLNNVSKSSKKAEGAINNSNTICYVLIILVVDNMVCMVQATIATLHSMC